MICRKIMKTISALLGLFITVKIVEKAKNKKNSTEKDNIYLKNTTSTKYSQVSIYERVVKRAIDIFLSFLALIILFPLFFFIGIAIFIDDPGSIIFKQKRVGKDKKYFYLHKFRSMKNDTPHDIPTHQLKNPEQYITNIGKLLRKTSLDELPQIWDIFCGNMSIIGPRPALWNQKDLIEEREKYGVNTILPGLTGWAQINGRDELEIPEKARLDGEYADWLKTGGVTALVKDVQCFLGTISSVITSKGVIEGEHKNEKKNDISNLQDTDTEPVKHKNILITGVNSYIGEALKTYLEQDSKHYSVSTLDTIGLEPRSEMFYHYDVVFNVAGIAHVKESCKNRKSYYEVNRNLAIKIASESKSGGVKQFIQLSSMSVYGLYTGFIAKRSIPHPVNAYGKSKFQADIALMELEDENFKVVLLRPPMVYGKDCKGNYQSLRSLAIRCPIFPEYRNKRSMIYIGNLCEFVKRVIDHECRGLFFPQNAEYVNTSNMAKLIAHENGKTIKTISAFNFLIDIVPFGIVKKAFGNLYYEQVDTVSKYSFEESIRFSEGK